MSYDVIVIGASAAGLSTAISLLEHGIVPLVIDRKARIGIPVQCAEYVPALFARVAPFISESIARSVEGMETFIVGDGKNVDKSLFSAPGFILHRDRWEKLLAARVLKLGGKIVLSTKALSISPDGSIETNKDNLSARVIVAADGPGSIAEKITGCKNRLMPAIQHTVALREPLERTMALFDKRIEGGYGWLFPKGELGNLGVGGWSDMSAMSEVTRKFFAEFVFPDILGSTGGHIPVGGVAQKVAVGNVLLVGDAAGFADPITGAGIAHAFESGKLAADTIAEFLCGKVIDLTGYERKISFLRRAIARSLVKRQEMENNWHDEDFIATIKGAWIGFRTANKAD